MSFSLINPALVGLAALTAVHVAGCTEQNHQFGNPPRKDGSTLGTVAIDGSSNDGDADSGADAGADGNRGGDAEQPRPCLVDGDCRAYEDCCQCRATPRWQRIAPCSQLCQQPRCALLGIQEPTAYCLHGNCVLGEGGGEGCGRDEDCQRFEDCGFCLALPRGRELPEGHYGCGHPLACHGLGDLVPICQNDRCRLAARDESPAYIKECNPDE